MKVLIVDDHEVIWSGMRGVVERLASQQQPPMPCETTCVRDVASARTLPTDTVDIILLDYHLPGTTGLDAFEALRERFEGAPIVIVSGDARPSAIRQAIEAGAAGYIPKTTSEREMIAALGLVLAHGIYLPPVALLDAGAADSGGADMDDAALAPFMAAELSPRQREVFAQALRGKPNKVIARELGIAEGTVKVHLAMVYRALGVSNRTEAMYRILSADAASAIGRM
jgi:DNA-binding NarL/FixJ family response regulator